VDEDLDGVDVLGHHHELRLGALAGLGDLVRADPDLSGLARHLDELKGLVGDSVGVSKRT
jgi:hypothetical protein